MRLDFSVIGFVEFTCYMIIFGFMWRALATRILANNPNNPVAKAMGFIF